MKKCKIKPNNFLKIKRSSVVHNSFLTKVIPTPINIWTRISCTQGCSSCCIQGQMSNKKRDTYARSCAAHMMNTKRKLLSSLTLIISISLSSLSPSSTRQQLRLSSKPFQNLTPLSFARARQWWHPSLSFIFKTINASFLSLSHPPSPLGRILTR